MMKHKLPLQKRCINWIVAKSSLLFPLLAILTLVVSAYFLLTPQCGVQCVNHYTKEIANMKDFQTIDSFFDRFFIINLERSVKRKERMANQMKKLGITNYEFFKAVDGSKLDIAKLQEEGIISRESKLTFGEIGCALSHIYVWQEMLARNLKTALICEDDAKFDKNINEIATLAMRDVPDEDWDIIHWYTHNESNPLRVHIKGYTESYGAVCYSISRRGAQYLVDIALPLKYPTDGITNWLTAYWTTGYKGYIILPTPVWPYRVKSAIDTVDSEKEQETRHMSLLKLFLSWIRSN